MNKKIQLEIPDQDGGVSIIDAETNPYKHRFGEVIVTVHQLDDEKAHVRIDAPLGEFRGGSRSAQTVAKVPFQLDSLVSIADQDANQGGYKDGDTTIDPGFYDVALFELPPGVRIL